MKAWPLMLGCQPHPCSISDVYFVIFCAHQVCLSWILSAPILSVMSVYIYSSTGDTISFLGCQCYGGLSSLHQTHTPSLSVSHTRTQGTVYTHALTTCTHVHQQHSLWIHYSCECVIAMLLQGSVLGRWVKHLIDVCSSCLFVSGFNDEGDIAQG